MSDLNRIERLWLDYRNTVIAPNAPSVQIIECRRAFYAGSLALFTELQIMLEPGVHPTITDVRKVELVRQELSRFNDQVKRGLA